MIQRLYQLAICYATGRSTRWPAVRKAFLAGKTCAACGGRDRLTPHHVIPVHVDKSLELEVDNLICLCEARDCHFRVGHAFNWRCWVPTVREDAALLLRRISERKDL